MDQKQSLGGRRSSRRKFLSRSAMLASAATVAGVLPLPRAAHGAGGGEEIKVALIGCGSRGTGAAAQALSTAGPVKLWAMADAFADRLESSLKNLQKGDDARNESRGHASMASKIDVPPERRFVGLDAYRKAIDSGVDLVLLAEPPGLRPAHFESAVRARKHVFMEKPLATDAPGIRRVLAAGQEAHALGLKVGVGLQRHHQPSYLETVARLHAGALDKILYMRCYWNGGPPAKVPHLNNGLKELEYQLRNWYFFTWLSGDHIVEQHIHNIDVCNWVLGGHPVRAQGMGGRQVRTGKEYGQIFDHHAVEFTYANGVKMFSYCRQLSGCSNSVAEYAHGIRGVANVSDGTIEADGQTVWQASSGGKLAVGKTRRKQPGVNPYQLEHDALFDAIRNNNPYNEVEYAAHSTMTAILGRMATYSGEEVTWEEAFASTLSLAPSEMAWDGKPTCFPDAEGRYPVAMPGMTKAW